MPDGAALIRPTWIATQADDIAHIPQAGSGVAATRHQHDITL